MAKIIDRTNLSCAWFGGLAVAKDDVEGAAAGCTLKVGEENWVHLVNE